MYFSSPKADRKPKTRNYLLPLISKTKKERISKGIDFRTFIFCLAARPMYCIHLRVFRHQYFKKRHSKAYCIVEMVSTFLKIIYHLTYKVKLAQIILNIDTF